MRTSLSLPLAAATLAVLTGCAADVAPNTAAVAARTDTQPSEQDRAWMRTIHQGNLSEVQAGRLAMGKGATKQVKNIGKLLLDDHTKLDVKVTQAATQLGVELPTSPSKAQQAEVRRLRAATGQDFDQDFLSGMIKAHREALAATKTQVSKGSNQTVKALAQTAQQSLQHHLDELEQAQDG
ncbi:DUF4142 domain-containing protein [Nonomuraea gerenzanensis]|uniref:Putative exported protein n=1 Tax=Nonomuraea gerenzanensis TaxID=93944 RepID=A0A1M4E8U5_9ACTN|nr:DUF4142 domain-containing protein [Nonomuraea gerenzanensis]UBU17557.1 DUF4142 domain-containing protein [Nonomuraea gerenzanensis]SBO95319.1 putative exported protein [Nonomuraea gerenzanensis]